jgi:hypothetical protein
MSGEGMIGQCGPLVHIEADFAHPRLGWQFRRTAESLENSRWGTLMPF